MPKILHSLLPKSLHFWLPFTSLPQSYTAKPFATILKDLPQPCWHWLTGGTFDSATGGTFQSDTDGTFHSDIPGTFESDMGGTFKVLQSILS